MRVFSLLLFEFRAGCRTPAPARRAPFGLVSRDVSVDDLAEGFQLQRFEPGMRP